MCFCQACILCTFQNGSLIMSSSLKSGVTSQCSCGKNRVLPCWLQSPAWSSSYRFLISLPLRTLATLPFSLPVICWCLIMPHGLRTHSSLCLKLSWPYWAGQTSLLQATPPTCLSLVMVEGACFQAGFSRCSPGWLKFSVIPNYPCSASWVLGLQTWCLLGKATWVLWLIPSLPTIISSMIAELLSGCPSYYVPMMSAS